MRESEYLDEEKKLNLDRITVPTDQNWLLQEIIDTAKMNVPLFPSLFERYFPDFKNDMLSRFSNASSKDIIFLGYLKLGFSTKEIAQYTFVTPKSVQMRKNRLRKKFNIPSEVDLYEWVYNIRNDSLSKGQYDEC